MVLVIKMIHYIFIFKQMDTILNNDVVITQILLNTNVDEINNVCFDKKLCNSAYFWKLRFEQDRLPLPPIMYDNLDDWVVCYHHTKKIKGYLEHIISVIPKYDTGINVEVHGIDIFKDFFDANVMKKLYIEWCFFSKYYFKDIAWPCDDHKYDCQVNRLFIVKNNDGYTLTFKFRNEIIIHYTEAQLQKLLFYLLSNYMYVYQYNENNKYDNILQF